MNNGLSIDEAIALSNIPGTFYVDDDGELWQVKTNGNDIRVHYPSSRELAAFRRSINPDFWVFLEWPIADKRELTNGIGYRNFPITEYKK